MLCNFLILAHTWFLGFTSNNWNIFHFYMFTENLTIKSSDFSGKLTIFAEESQRYLCFNKRWKLVGMVSNWAHLLHNYIIIRTTMLQNGWHRSEILFIYILNLEEWIIIMIMMTMIIERKNVNDRCQCYVSFTKNAKKILRNHSLQRS